MTDANTSDAPTFEVRDDGHLWVIRSGKAFDLGPAERAHEAMAQHLTAHDFAE